MKILIIANNSAGLYAFRADLIRELIQSGHELYACTPFGSDVEELRSLGIKLIEIHINRRGINPFEDLKLIKEINKVTIKLRPEYIITYTIKPNIYGGIVARIHKIPYAINVAGLGTAFEKKGILNHVASILYRIAMKKAEVCFFENKGDRDIAQGKHLFPEGRDVVLAGAGVDLNKYTFQKLPSDHDTVHFLFIGRVMREKGIDELFYAMKKLVETGEKCKLTIVGGMEENYEKQMTTYTQEGWLTYAGYQNDILPYVYNTDCFVLPSWHEGMANVNLENAACGRPIITSNIPGCKEAVVDGVSGFLCDVKNAESLFECMKQFLRLSPYDRQKMGLEGRTLMEKCFDKKSVVKKTIQNLNYS